jgi:phage baseplate assembly protein W
MANSTISYAIDISVNPFTKGVITDKDAIAQSLEMIILTLYRERVFNASIGSVVGVTPFNRLNESSGEAFLDDLLETIANQENRISLLSNSCGLTIMNNGLAIIIKIVYMIKASGLLSIFEKKVF